MHQFPHLDNTLICKTARVSHFKKINATLTLDHIQVDFTKFDIIFFFFIKLAVKLCMPNHVRFNTLQDTFVTVRTTKENTYILLINSLL